MYIRVSRIEAALLGLFLSAFFHYLSDFGSFLDASSHLYKRVCPSVGPSVGPLRLFKNREYRSNKVWGMR